MVKQCAADTTLQNAERDGAEFAWIPNGDSCAFCEMLASRGWQRISKRSLKDGHAEHIHANCKCEYAIRFDSKTNYKGYNPDKYKEEFENAEGDTWEEKLNSIRRERYAESNDSNSVPDAIAKFEDKYRNAKIEHIMITDTEGKVWDENTGHKDHVSHRRMGDENVGYTLSHNHPEPETFSPQDIKDFELSGMKQIRAFTPDNTTYTLTSNNPTRLKEGNLDFTGAWTKQHDVIDEYITQYRREQQAEVAQIADREERRKAMSDLMEKVLSKKHDMEDTWLEENAKKYGYIYKVIHK